jgi:hypothetical protein
MANYDRDISKTAIEITFSSDLDRFLNDFFPGSNDFSLFPNSSFASQSIGAPLKTI